MPSTDAFRTELEARISRAFRQGRSQVEVNAGELHRSVGGYPGIRHAMPACCNVMRQEFDALRDEIVHEPPSGKGASLTIRYLLPR